MKTHFRRRETRKISGFALVATLLLMILLTVIAVGLLTLSSVSLRSSNSTSELSKARANARVAMMLALGELQKQTGSDTRVTARADVLDENNPPVLGVWKSWEGTDHTTSGSSAGRPVSPGNYKTVKQGRFLSWLVSGDMATLGNSTSAPDVAAASNKVPLVGVGSVGEGTGRDKLQVHLAPSLITSNNKGACAWWIGGENQKARLGKPYEPAANTTAGWTALAKSHTIADPEVFRAQSLLTDPAPVDKAITAAQTVLFTEKKNNLSVSQEFFHDLSTISTGLLTNTATGGWRKDFSLLTENWAALPKTNLPFFRVEPGKDLSYSIPVSGGDYRPDKSLIYPWSSYRGDSNSLPIYQHGAVSSWANLQSWATLYKAMTGNGTQIASRSTRIDFPNNVPDKLIDFDFLHKVRIIPVIARVQWVFSHWAAPSTTPAGTFEPRLLVTPVLTLWNPYNVTITSSALTFKVVGCLPNAFKYNVGGVQNLQYNRLLQSSDPKKPPKNNTPALFTAEFLQFQIDKGYTFKPGETMLFSPTPTPFSPGTPLVLEPGFRKQGGHYFGLKKDDNTDVTGIPGSATVKADAKFNSIYYDSADGVGIYLDMYIAGARHLVYRMIYDVTVAETVYPAITGLAPTTLTEASASPQPFLTTIFGARTASKTHLAAKGFVQTSPLVNYTAMGSKDTVESTIQWDYPGTAHPVNSPFDYSFEKLAGGADSLMPNTDTANHGFIVTGFQSADGLSRCVIDELPTRPIQSLAELQNWDLRYENPIPPYSFNIIGNSDASPLIPAGAVYNSGNSIKGGQDLQHDDSYCANHLLFDDWFASSITPQSTNLGNPSASETLKKTYTDFVSGKTPLPNRAYQPIAADRALGQTTSGADTLYNNYAAKTDSWKTIASRMEVEGMFNVNSTSVGAWRALLGHARGQKISYLTTTGSTLSGKEDYNFSRFSIAGDVEAKSKGSSGGFSACAQFAGYRRFDDPVLDRLAEEIVKQIRARGPFLSLAEFVNRQLSSGNPALAGTIQAALNALEKDASINPYAVIESGSKASTSAPPAPASTGYSFPDAAVGYNAYGLPGWTRQADVLRPLAPILSARDDTFTIRAYGDSRDASGKVTVRATCEAVVRRTRDYVDPADAPEITTLPKSTANLTFGRRYQIVSFRWLSAGEI